MTTTRRGWRSWWLWLVGGLLLALAAAALVLWWFGTHTSIERTISLPAQGEAAHNPLYLLRQALHADGVDAQSHRHLRADTIALAHKDTVVLFSDPRTLTGLEVEHLLAWVLKGGHLIVRLPSWRTRYTREWQMGELLDTLGIVPAFPARLCHDVKIAGAIPKMMACDGQRFIYAGDKSPDVAWGAADSGWSFIRLAWGKGSVDVFSRLDFLANDELGNPAHAALARQLLAPNYGRGTVHLIHDAQFPSLWRLLLEYGRMAWVPLLLALAAWLWMRMPRFGPLRPSPAPARRALLEHIEASGEYLYRHGREDVLLAALRAEFWQWLRRHDPLATSLDGPARIAAIAARTGESTLDVAKALEADFNPAHHAADFRRRAEILLRMRQP